MGTCALCGQNSPHEPINVPLPSSPETLSTIPQKTPPQTPLDHSQVKLKVQESISPIEGQINNCSKAPISSIKATSDNNGSGQPLIYFGQLDKSENIDHKIESESYHPSTGEYGALQNQFKRSELRASYMMQSELKKKANNDSTATGDSNDISKPRSCVLHHATIENSRSSRGV